MSGSSEVIKFNQEDADKLFEILQSLRSKEEAEAIAHAMTDIAESIREVYVTLLPGILAGTATGENDSKSLLWDIREAFRHIDYHIHDANLIDL